MTATSSARTTSPGTTNASSFSVLRKAWWKFGSASKRRKLAKPTNSGGVIAFQRWNEVENAISTGIPKKNISPRTFGATNAIPHSA